MNKNKNKKPQVEDFDDFPPETPLSLPLMKNEFFWFSIFLFLVLNVPVLYFLLNEQPSVRRALPPVGWQRTVAQEPQMTTVWACEKTVVMLKQPGHFTSIKNERGAGTRVYGLGNIRQILDMTIDSVEREGGTFSLCLRASAAGAGLRRSSART